MRPVKAEGMGRGAKGEEPGHGLRAENKINMAKIEKKTTGVSPKLKNQK